MEEQDYSKASALDVIKFMSMDNIALEVDDNKLRKIGEKVVEEYKDDDETRSEWKKINKDALKLAKQTLEEKTFPWKGAANVKYPLIGQAALQFNARAYPEIIQGDKVVKAQVIGEDENQEKEERADRISTHMSHQLLVDVPNWESDTDKLLIMLPIMGTMFREISWDEVNLRPQISLLMPDELVVNYYAKSLDLSECRRISKEITFYRNDIRERERMGLWIAIDYTEEAENEDYIEEDEQCFIQQCRYLDLDEDGYEEPYVVWVHKASRQVVRIVALYDETTVKVDVEKGEVVKIEPLSMYADYHFIPSFDGAFYSLGYGSYLFTMNKTIDSLINQLIDAGTLSNTQGGLVGKGLRMKTGATPMMPGEFRPVESKGVSIKDNIVLMPTKEPSMTLYQLMVFLIDTGKQMSSVTDVMSGVPQGQNTPVGTTLAMIEQGMKVMDAVYKRVYLALAKEFKLLYKINHDHFGATNYLKVLDDENAVFEDYNTTDLDVIPVGDSRISSQIMRTMKAQAARDIAMNTPGADVRAATKILFEAMDIPKDQIGEILPEMPSQSELMAENDTLKGQIQVYQEYINTGKLKLAVDESERKNMETEAKTTKDKASAVKFLVEAEKIKSETEGQNLENDLIETGAMRALQDIEGAEFGG